MKRNNRSNSVLAIFGRGIKQTAHWVARMFGYKAENKFARAVWYVLATSFTLASVYVVVALSIIFFKEMGDIHRHNRYRRMVNSPTYLHNYDNQYVSPYVVYHDSYPSYLYNTTTGRRTATGIHWICKSSDRDSLACFSTIKEHKRGYFNRFTGEVTIPAQYEKAWIFSEGLACVMEQGELHFIDHKGKPAIDKTFTYMPCIDAYCFHNGLCIMSDGNGMIGLINRNGEWEVEPKYKYVSYETKDFWLVQDADGHQGLLCADGEPLLPSVYDEIIVRNTGYISVRTLDHLDELYDIEGNLVNSCDYRDVEKQEYFTDEHDENGDLKMATAHCLKYRSSDYHYGLMDREGNVITMPLYDQITAVAVNLYLCEGDEGSVILDDKGRECGEKL